MSILQRIKAYMSTPSISFYDVRGIMAPLIVDALLNALIMVSNTAMIASSGETAMSAVSLVDSFAFLIVNFFIAIATGGTVVVAQYMGRGQPAMAGRTAAQAMLSAVFIGVLLGIPIFIFADNILIFIFGDLQYGVLELGALYMRGLAISFVPFAATQVFMGIMRGLHNARGAMLISALSNSTLILLTFITVMLRGMSVSGIVVALIIARLVGFAFGTYLLYRMRAEIGLKIRHFLRIDVSIQRSVLLIGIPTAIEQIFFHGGRMITQRFIVMGGLFGITANAIAMSIINLIIVPGSAAMLGIVPLVGRCVGARAYDEARSITKKVCVAFGVLQTFMLLVYYPVVPLIVKLYHPTLAVARTATHLAYIHATFQSTLWVTSFVLPAALRAAGDAKYTSVIALIAMWAVRVTLSYYMAITLNMGAYGVWWAMVVEWIVRTWFFVRRFDGSKWLSHEII